MNSLLSCHRIFLLVVVLFATFAVEAPRSLSAEETPHDFLAAYLLPEDHPMKPKLDRIFDKAGVIKSRSALKDNGFIVNTRRHPNNVLVAWHKRLKGHLLKIYTDDQPQMVDWQNWVKRINGIEIVRAAIERNGYGSLLKAPKKWMYRLPHIENPEDKQYILVVEDMVVFSDDSNRKCWKNPGWVTNEHLQALFTVIKEEGLIDSLYIDNVPFSVDLRIAFVDTEHTNVWPVKFNNLSPYLSGKSRKFWESLFIENH